MESTTTSTTDEATNEHEVQEVIDWLNQFENSRDNALECPTDEVPADIVYENIQRAAENTRDNINIGMGLMLTDWDVCEDRIDVTFYDGDNLKTGYPETDTLFEAAKDDHHLSLVAESEKDEEENVLARLAGEGRVKVDPKTQPEPFSAICKYEGEDIKVLSHIETRGEGSHQERQIYLSGSYEVNYYPVKGEVRVKSDENGGDDA